MDPRKWIPALPLFGTPMCVYCGGAANSSDHTPPRCLLPRSLPSDFQAMTVPSCTSCNGAYSLDELRAATVICSVSFTEPDREAVAKGGWVYAKMRHDKALQRFIDDRLGSDGIFRPDRIAIETLSRVFVKTVVGLLFFEFGRIVNRDELSVVALEHANNVHPDAFVELHRRDDNLWAEVTPTGRELERQVMAVLGIPPAHMPKWRVYVPGWFEYMFIRRSNKALICAMKLHDTLTVVVECPWPARAGPRRKGRPPG